MVLKKFSRLSMVRIIFVLLTLYSFSTLLAAEDNADYPRSIELHASEEFTFVRQESSTFTIRPLKTELRSIENLKDVEAVGVSYLGNIILGKNATPLSALRDVSLQISKGLNIDLALITDSTTSQSLAPHELLLLYHPKLMITLALTKVAKSEPIDTVESDQETEQDVSEDTIEKDEYSLIGTYAVPATPQPELIPAVSEEVAE